MKLKMNILLVVVAPFVSTIAMAADESEPIPSIEEKLAGFAIEPESHTGFFSFYWDSGEGKIWLEIDRWDTEFLYVTSLAAGLGSNDIGLDRNQLGRRRVVKFERVGPKVLLVQSNYRYRAASEDADERKAVEEAFARSVVWGFTVAADDGARVLVDATDFFLADAHAVSNRIKSRGQGTAKLDESRSALYLPRTKNFPRNTEVEATLTFTVDSPGRYLREVAPDALTFTIREHHSLVELPGPGYEPRAFDPRSGANSVAFADYATPIDQPLEKRLTVRHRLKKKDPAARVSDPVEPIVYYLDRGTPEPIRSALLDGARWWNQSFEAIGYRDAFRVELLPEDADPMDLNYNVINWVHRSTRGWSYGASVVDPRTGEIIKGHVALGSLRVRQDFLIAQGLAAPYVDGAVDTTAAREMALARLRQLSAHEVGHTLGFAHNFAASVSGRASVMDYPHPLILIDGDQLDFSQAYDDGIGAWDTVAVAYSYQDFPEGTNESAALTRILDGAINAGLQFMSDDDARPPGGAHPQAHLWDNGEDAAAELARVLKIREIALDRFSEANIPRGTAMSNLEEVLVPLYFFHRYQAEAAVKVIGGLQYTYAVRGDAQTPVQFVEASFQLRALDALLATLDPDTLTLPEHVLAIVPPRAYGATRHRETFCIRTGLTLDPITLAESAADFTVGLLLHPARAARLLEHHARDEDQPSLHHVLDSLLDATWGARTDDGLQGEVQRAVRYVVLKHLMSLAASPDSPPQVRATADSMLTNLVGRLGRRLDQNMRIQAGYAQGLIEQYRNTPERFVLESPPALPPGSPIGSGPARLCSFSTDRF